MQQDGYLKHLVPLSSSKTCPKLIILRNTKIPVTNWNNGSAKFYPNGLNEKGSGGNKNSNIDEVAVRKIFSPPFRIGIRQDSSRLQRKSHVSFNLCRYFYKQLNDILQNNLYNSFNKIRVILNDTRKRKKY